MTRPFFILLILILPISIAAATDQYGSTAYRQLKFLLTDLSCSSRGTCDLATGTTIGGITYTQSTATPTDGVTACSTGDRHLETDAFKFYACVDGSTDKWYGVQLVDTP